MKKIVVIGHNNPMTINFRGDLIRDLISKGYWVSVVGPDMERVDEMLALGIDSFEAIPMERTGTSIIGDLKYTLALRRYLKKVEPDIVFGFTIKPVIYGSIAAKSAGVKNINSMLTGIGYLFVSDSLKAKVVKQIAKFLYKIGLGCATNVIFQNKDDLREFVDSGLVNKAKCHLVNGSGVDMVRFQPAPYPEQLTFFMTSRLLYSKGTMEYFKAAEIVKQKYPKVRFVILGAIDTKADCIPIEVVKPFFDNGIIDYLGTSNNVAGMLTQSSVYVLPSYREGVPRSVMEAMAMARPIITTDVPGCRETVIDGENGFLIPPMNIEALAEKLEWFVLNQGKIEQMGEKSYQICKQKFEISVINNRMEEIMKI